MRQSAILFILFALGFVFLVGCQATPEKPVVVQKDMEQMIEKAAGSEAENADQTKDVASEPKILLKDRVQAPDFLTLGIEKDNFTLAVDASVIVPQAYKMPIIQVKAGEFSQEQVTAFWDALLGDTEMWQRQTKSTKSEIADWLVGLRKYLQDESCEEAIEELKAHISYLEKEYDTAPEKIEMSMVDSTLKKIEITRSSGEYGGWTTGVRGSSKDSSIGFSVQNLIHEGLLEYSSTPRMAYSSSDADHNYGQINTLEVNEDTELDESIKQYMKTTPAEAKALVEDFLKQTNTPMIIHSMKLVNDEETGRYDSVVAPAEHYAYKIFCTRMVDNVLPTACILGSTYVEDEDNPDPDYIMEWNYEEVGFKVNDNGIIEMSWFAPLELLETKVEDSALMPFSEIQAVLEKMIPIKFEATAKDMDNLTCRIEDIRLEMMRVVEQGSIENGLLIPVWNFYGVRSRTYNGEVEETGKYILLCVNAIDGSIIDTSKGY